MTAWIIISSKWYEGSASNIEDILRDIQYPAERKEQIIEQTKKTKYS